MTRSLLALALLSATALATTSLAQQEGPTVTQALVTIDSKTASVPTARDLTLKVNDRLTPLTSLAPIPPTGAQVALLIDDGLRVSVGRELGALRSFLQSLRPGIAVFVGYMQNGRVVPAQRFTTDFASAARSLRTPLGSAGLSASPYFCLSDFVKKWPASSHQEQPESVDGDQFHLGSSRSVPKARFVLMMTNGVDPYNGSTDLQNQNSPYVLSAIADAQRAGVAVYSIYFSDAGYGGQSASFSGQSYLSQVAQGTGGAAYYLGTGNPVSIDPFLKNFQDAVAETYVATFNAPGGKEFVRIKLSSSVPRVKLHAPEQVRPGTRISGLNPASTQD